MKSGPATARLLYCPMSTKTFSNFQLDDEDQDDQGNADVDHGKAFCDILKASMAAVIVKIILNMLVSNRTVRNISCDSGHKLFSVYHPAHGKFNVTIPLQ